MSSLIRLAFACATASLIACGTAEDAVLDELPIADEQADAKADQLTTYAWVRPSIGSVRCLRAPCASNLSRAVNGGESRLTYLFDLRALSLSAAEREDVTAHLSDMLLRGRYATVQVSGQSMTVFQVTRALRPVGDKAADSPTTDRYYSLSTVQCVTAPCPLAARPLNGSGQEIFTSVDLSRLQLSAQGATQLSTDLGRGSVYISVPTTKGSTATASQAFRSVK